MRTVREIFTFKVHVNTVLSTLGLALPDDDNMQDLLPEIRLPFLDGGHHHISDTSRGQAFTVAATDEPSDILNLFPAKPPCPDHQ
ncbi:hypothetical protein V6N11_008500 [Hibiscus sabdariffa]|uniref:Uncharacterized protein n=1 Tax=Hibiscus sabdariffa TaxID=183260 RepID=A0ABR1ZV97_9ROSI